VTGGADVVDNEGTTTSAWSAIPFPKQTSVDPMRRKNREILLIHNPFLSLILEELLSHRFILHPEASVHTIALSWEW
jgi:hypothetical protein